jgi:plastocyanin
MTGTSRRRLLRLGGVAALGALAGCAGEASTGEDDEGTTDGGTATTPSDPEPTAATTTPTDAPTASPTPRPRYHADQLGGPDDLRSDPTVRAVDIAEYDGPAPYAFTPAIGWVETGSTVTWAVEGGTHAIAAYHPDVGRTLRIPEAAEPFDAGVLGPGDSFEHTFETPGVYNYLCEPHEAHGMVGVLVVGEARPGPGTVHGSNVEVAVAGEHLTRLLGVAGIDVTAP